MIVAKTNIVISSRVTLPVGTVITSDHMSEEDIQALLAKGALAEIEEGTVLDKPQLPLASEGKDAKPWQWAFDPAVIAGMDLDMLNMVAADHCAEQGVDPIPPFTTVEEALAFMTQDLE